jgi:plasmid stabilization system protein ParE
VAEIVWSGPAVEDLRQIHEFIGRDSKKYAAIMVLRIRAAVERLAKFPDSGREVPEFSGSGYREVIEGHYRAIYRHNPARNRVLVVAVVHASRLLPPVIEGR